MDKGGISNNTRIILIAKMKPISSLGFDAGDSHLSSDANEKMTTSKMFFFFVKVVRSS
jgi:hypothetical protein